MSSPRMRLYISSLALVLLVLVTFTSSLDAEHRLRQRINKQHHAVDMAITHQQQQQQQQQEQQSEELPDLSLLHVSSVLSNKLLLSAATPSPIAFYPLNGDYRNTMSSSQVGTLVWENQQSGVTTSFTSFITTAKFGQSWQRIKRQTRARIVLPNKLPKSYTKIAWVYAYIPQNVDINVPQNLISTSSDTASGAHMLMLYNDRLTSGGSVTSTRTIRCQDPNPFPRNEWVHIVNTYDATTRKMALYRNGIKVKENTLATDINPGNVNGIAIGNAGESQENGFAGLISNVGIYNVALTSSDVFSIVGRSLN